MAEQILRRAFVAIEPDSETRNRISLVAGEMRQFGLPMKYVEPENYHINLDFLGDVGERELAVQREKWEGISKSLGYFKIAVRGISAFPNTSAPRVVFAGCESTELASLGSRELGREFAPHITIGRVKRLGGNFGGLFQKLGEIEFGHFIAKEILLKESTLTREGPIYGTIGEFKLRGRQ